MIQAGLSPPNRNPSPANKQKIAKNKQNIQANKQNIASNKKAIDANATEATEASKRFSELSDYDTRINWMSILRAEALRFPKRTKRH